MRRTTSTNAEQPMWHKDPESCSKKRAKAAVELKEINANDFGEWLDQSLSQLVEVHGDYVTKNSWRRYFSR